MFSFHFSFVTIFLSRVWFCKNRVYVFLC